MTPNQVNLAVGRAPPHIIERIKHEANVAFAHWTDPRVQPPITAAALIAAQHVAIQLELIAGGLHPELGSLRQPPELA